MKDTETLLRTEHAGSKESALDPDPQAADLSTCAHTGHLQQLPPIQRLDLATCASAHLTPSKDPASPHFHSTYHQATRIAPHHTHPILTQLISKRNTEILKSDPAQLGQLRTKRPRVTVYRGKKHTAESSETSLLPKGLPDHRRSTRLKRLRCHPGRP